MTLREEFTEVVVEDDLLPQVVRELTQLAENQNHVEVTHGVNGRVVLVHPVLAELWFQKVMAKNEAEDSGDSDVEDNGDSDVVEAPDDSEVSPESTVAESTTSESASPVAQAPTEEWVPPVKRGPGRPRKYPPAPSVSNGEES